MNWHKKIILKTAAAQSKINKLRIAKPSLKFFVHRYENSVGIDWNKIKSSEDLETHISSNLLPSLHSKIDPSSEKNNYLKSEFLDLEAEFREHQDDPQAQQAWRIYQSNPEAAKQRVLSVINDGKQEIFKGWWNYLTQEDESYKDNPAFAYSVLKPLIDSSPENVKNPPAPLNAEALASIWNEISDQGVTQMNILKKYRKISSKMNRQGAETVNATGEGEWIKIPSKLEDPGHYDRNLSKLQAFSQNTGWCVAQPYHSNLYLSKGDFWMYMVGDKPVVAIKLTGDKHVDEIRGHHNNKNPKKYLYPYWQEITDFLHSSNLNYEDNGHYKEIQNIYSMNKNLERGSKDYQIVLGRVQRDHKIYLQISEENRQKFPEFLEAARIGYMKELEVYLTKMEKAADDTNFLIRFDEFQNYYNGLPPEIKAIVTDLNPRILRAYKKAFHSNPVIFTEFSTEIQKQFSKEEQTEAWVGYVIEDPYHYNDSRIPKDIRQAMPLKPLKVKFEKLLQQNSEHIDYIPPEILSLWEKGELEQYVLRDFARYPVSRAFGKLDKLDRVERLVAQGRISHQQVMESLSNSVTSNPQWFNILPPKYQKELMGGGRIRNLVEEEKRTHILRDVGYFKNLSLDQQNQILKSNGAEIGQAFAKQLTTTYRGLYHPFWINTPASVRPYLPFEIIDATAQYYVNEINKNPSNQEAMLEMVSPDIRPFVFSKLGAIMNWYKKIITGGNNGY